MASSNPDAIESLGDIDGEIYQNVYFIFSNFTALNRQYMYEKFDHRLLAKNGFLHEEISKKKIVVKGITINETLSQKFHQYFNFG